MINKSVIITGASKGIGAATAYLLAKNKFNVAIIYKSSDKEAKKVLAKCNNYSDCILIKADVTNDKDCKNLVDSIDYRISQAYDSLIPTAYKADIWRYCVLYKYGGVYGDMTQRFFKEYKH